MKLQDLKLWSLMGLKVIDNVVTTDDDKMSATLSDNFLKDLEQEKNTLKSYEKILQEIGIKDNFSQRAFEKTIKVSLNHRWCKADFLKDFYDKTKDIKPFIDYIKENPKNPYNFKISNNKVSIGKSHENYAQNFLEFVKNEDKDLITKIYFIYDKNTYFYLQNEIIDNFLKNYAKERDYRLEILSSVYDFNFKGTTEYKEIDEYLKTYNSCILDLIGGNENNSWVFNRLIRLKIDKECTNIEKRAVYKAQNLKFKKLKVGGYVVHFYDNKDKFKMYSIPLDLDNLDENFSDIKLVFSC